MVVNYVSANSIRPVAIWSLAKRMSIYVHGIFGKAVAYVYMIHPAWVANTASKVIQNPFVSAPLWIPM